MIKPSSHLKPTRARSSWSTVAALCVALGAMSLAAVDVAQAQLSFPERPRPERKPSRTSDPEMLVRAARIDYDYTNKRVSAVGNVQIYYQGSTIEADKVTYDQNTKRFYGEGNVRLTEPDGNVTHGQILDFSDDFRDGFVDSLRVETVDQTRMAANRARRTGGNFTVFESGVYTACEACKEDPKKPPLWQVKAARIVHDQTEKMIYFEGAQFEVFGTPIAYLPYFSAPDPTVKRKSGFLIPTASTSNKYGAAVEIPYFWALAPNYDFTFSPMITTQQGPLLKGEWRQRLDSGAFTVRAAGIYQLDKDYFIRDDGSTTPGYRDWRGSIETNGLFSITDRWAWGWAGTLLSDKTFYQDYGLQGYSLNSDPVFHTQMEAVSQLFLTGRGDRSYFDLRGLSYYGFSESDVQSQLPVVHPVLDYAYTFLSPVFGGQLDFKANLTSLTRTSADFDPISDTALNSGACLSANPAVRNSANCLLRGIPGTYTRFSAETTWKKTITDPFGQVFTPFASLRADVASMQIDREPGVSNFIKTGSSDDARFMPTVGLEYRYPFIAVQSWGTQTIEPIAQVIIRPNETNIGNFPNEDAQSLVFDDTNLFRVDKFSGWDRVEGGSRANVGIQYRAQFNGAGSVSMLVGQSYQLFGQNSYAVPSLTNTGLDSGLDKSQSDYVAGVRYQPNSLLAFGTHFRFDEHDFTMRRFEFETTANLGRWTTTVVYGDYAAQPLLGILDRQQGILGAAQFKITANWSLLGAARYDIQASRVNQTQVGVGYIDDCLILALNYVSDYSYSGNPTADHRVMFQIGLRTLGGSSVSQTVSGTNTNPATRSAPLPTSF